MRTEGKWRYIGKLFSPDTSLWWSKTHAMLPTVLHMKADSFKIFYSGRDMDNRSHIGCFDLHLSGKPEVTSAALEPVLSPGRLGTFDDNGVSPSSVVRLQDGSLALYYIGWNPGSTTRVNLFGGLAISQKGDDNFVRLSEAPILERIPTDPFMNTAPFVIPVESGFRMYYVSGSRWETRDSPRYNIKVAHSSDGLHWIREGQVVLDFEDANETALARPWVTRDGSEWHMWFSSRRGEYRIRHAQSGDGIKWIRTGPRLGLDPDAVVPPTSMTEYSAVVTSTAGAWMLFNGLDYGRDGIHIAKLES